MHRRRPLLSALALPVVLVVGLALSPLLAGAPASATPHHPTPRKGLVGLVDPFVGTKADAPDFGTGGGAGNTYPGATTPFGMVQWSPDTVLHDVNYSGGYGYDDTHLSGFSLTSMSGAGCATYRDLPFLPTTRPITSSPARPLLSELSPTFQPRFDHAHESASAGRYRVTLDPDTRRAIGVDLSATTRTGSGVFTFPRGTTSSVMVNAGGSLMADQTADVRIDPARREITGEAQSGLFCYQGGFYKVYFDARFDRPFTAHGTWTKQLLQRGSDHAHDFTPLALNYGPIPGLPDHLPGNPGDTAQAGAYVTFDTRRDRAVRVRVGLSFVSVGEARRNLQAEQPTFDPGAVRLAATAAWQHVLDHARVTGGSRSNRTIFATALYHAFLEPRTFSDDDGTYAGMDGKVHRARGYTQYADFSGWDVYRSQVPLLALLMPHRASDLVRSLLADYQQGGQLPKWPFADQDTDEMTGDPSDGAIAGAWAMGARGFDKRLALHAMVEGATVPHHPPPHHYVERAGLELYESLGYLPAELEHHLGGLGTFVDPSFVWGPTATTLEYADADWAVAAFARSSHQTSAASQALLRRSNDWRHVFDPATGYVQPRSLTGAFTSSYDPASGDTFVEGSGAQYTFGVLHDPRGLVAALGGRTAARARLDTFFAKLNDGPSSVHAFLGNEPTLHTPYLYDWVGAPSRTARVVRTAMETLYNAGPGGLPGNDDLGTMSSWWVLGALGFYPVSPGSSTLAVGSPLFPKVDLELGGHRVSIVARHAPATYVGRLDVDGRSRDKAWITSDLLRHHHRLVFTMHRTPTAWATKPGAAPPQ